MTVWTEHRVAVQAPRLAHCGGLGTTRIVPVTFRTWEVRADACRCPVGSERVAGPPGPRGARPEGSWPAVKAVASASPGDG